MTDRDDKMTPESEREHLAAEYVLGVLDADQRARCLQLIASDVDFAGLVATWEDRLSPLNAAYAEVAPPANTLSAVESRLFGDPAPAGIWNSLRLWRAGAIAALLALAVVAGLNAGLFGPGPTGQGAQMIATLQADGSNAQFAALYDADDGTIRISAVAGAPDEDRDFELWFIEGGNAPVSLGLLNRAGASSIAVPAGQRNRIADGTIFAVSHEPLGGSTTGAPTGPVVAAGAIHKI
jgi:anti-sigma-K factor RskA